MNTLITVTLNDRPGQVFPGTILRWELAYWTELAEYVHLMLTTIDPNIFGDEDYRDISWKMLSPWPANALQPEESLTFEIYNAHSLTIGQATVYISERQI